MITRPDQYTHQNSSYAIVDGADVRGGIKDVASLTNGNLLAIPVDKRKLRTAITNGADSNIYVYSGSDLLDANWGNTSNWINPASSGYTHPTGFTDQPTSPLTGSNIISQIDVTSEGHVNSVVTRSLTPADIGAASVGHTHAYQPLDADLTAISGLSGNVGILRKTAADTWGLDINNYITGNQTITLSGDVTGSGTTSIVTTVGNDSHSHTSATVSGLAPSGGVTGYVLKKDSAADYDYSWQDVGSIESDGTYNYGTVPTTQITVTVGMTIADINAALPTTLNLNGGSLNVIFAAGSAYTFTTGDKLDLGNYYNGTVTVASSSTSINSTINYNTTTRGFIVVPTTDVDFNLMNLVINHTSTYSVGGDYSLIYSLTSSATNRARNIKISDCIINYENGTSTIDYSLMYIASKLNNVGMWRSTINVVMNANPGSMSSIISEVTSRNTSPAEVIVINTCTKGSGVSFLNIGGRGDCVLYYYDSDILATAPTSSSIMIVL